MAGSMMPALFSPKESPRRTVVVRLTRADPAWGSNSALGSGAVCALLKLTEGRFALPGMATEAKTATAAPRRDGEDDDGDDAWFDSLEAFDLASSPSTKWF